MTLRSLGLATFASVVTLVVIACTGEETGTLADPAFEGVEWVQRGIGVEYTIASSGVRESILRGDTIFSYGENGRDSTVVIGLHLEIYDAAGLLRATILSDSGWLHPYLSQLEARGEAKLSIPAEDRVIESDTMFFDYQEPGQVTSDMFTRIIDPEKVICGTGFVSDLEFRNVQVSQMRTGSAQCSGG